MTQHDDGLSLRQMLEHAREATALVAHRLRRDLDTDRVLELALVRLCEIVGEAACWVSTARRDTHPEIPWRAIIGMRNRLTHGYDSINHDILWRILTEDLPMLVDTLQSIVKNSKKP